MKQRRKFIIPILSTLALFWSISSMAAVDIVVDPGAYTGQWELVGVSPVASGKRVNAQGYMRFFSTILDMPQQLVDDYVFL